MINIKCDTHAMYIVSQKGVLLNFGDNFVKFERIFKILSLLESGLNFQDNMYHYAITMSIIC